MEAIHVLPGYTHNIINLSDTQDLVTVMWANEQFDPEHPDTFLSQWMYRNEYKNKNRLFKCQMTGEWKIKAIYHRRHSPGNYSSLINN